MDILLPLDVREVGMVRSSSTLQYSSLIFNLMRLVARMHLRTHPFTVTELTECYEQQQGI